MNNSLETIVAVVSPQMVAGEDKLAVEVSNIETEAERIVVKNDDEYSEAAEFGRLLKQKMSEVSEFFAPMKKSAHDAHKQICDREKQMLAPLKQAEMILKDSMGAYVLKKEQERKAAEEAARLLAQEEANRKLSEAADAEKNGNESDAMTAMLDAEIADTAARLVKIDADTPKAKGVSVQQDWEITNIKEAEVPTEIAGVVIRPVDTSAIMKLIRASKGTIKIAGINYQETTKLSFRRS